MVEDIVGKEFNSNSSGKFLVTKKLNEFRNKHRLYEIRFLNTGNKFNYPKYRIKEGKIKDDIIFSKYIGKIYNKDTNYEFVVLNKKNEGVFDILYTKYNYKSSITIPNSINNIILYEVRKDKDIVMISDSMTEIALKLDVSRQAISSSIKVGNKCKGYIINKINKNIKRRNNVKNQCTIN